MNATPTAPLQNPLAFLFGGNAIFTVQNTATGNRFTFKVRQPKPDAPHFVSVMTGSDNESSYEFLGTIFNRATYRPGSRSKIAQDAPSAVAFAWFFKKLVSASVPAIVHICHCGRCGRCGRLLTTPESIDLGIGPECAKQMAA